ncbi:MAG: response regulator [Fimbriimonas sp.]
MSLCIVLIEDNRANLELMSYLLRAHGHQVWTAMNGDDGIRLVSEHLPHIVLCDIHMPGATGLDVVRALRADPAVAAIPVVAVTAYAMVGDRESILSAGFDGYLSKPIDPENFVCQVTGLAQGDDGSAP